MDQLKEEGSGVKVNVCEFDTDLKKFFYEKSVTFDKMLASALN